MQRRDVESVPLNNGITMPRLGLGVFRAGSGDGTRNVVRHALEVGYRHIDTAAVYGNEVEVGEALRAWCAETGADRREVFVTTKLWNSDHGYDRALEAFARSRERLDIGLVDLFLLHWPVPELRLDSWRALETLLERGECRAIGVSNFMVPHLEELAEHARILPQVNQIELHPFLPQRDVVDWCRARGIQTVAYSPLTKGRLLDSPELDAVAARLGRSPAQVLIRWSLEQGHVVLPKSANPERIDENARVFDFELDDEAQRILAALEEHGVRIAWDPTQVD